jgi:hypothetical protein
MTVFPITSQRRRLISALGAVVAALALVVTAGPAAAHPAYGADVTREIIVNEVQVEHTNNNCSGAEGTFSRTFRGFVQTTTRPDGTTLFRGWIRADDATFVPDDPTQPTFTGREQVQVSMLSNSATTTTSFVLHFWATGSDSSKAAFKEVEHLTISAGGELEFEKPVVIC